MGISPLIGSDQSANVSCDVLTNRTVLQVLEIETKSMLVF